jgi:hypothetical protein
MSSCTRFWWTLASTAMVAVQGDLRAVAAEREQPRMVVNLIGAVKEPFGPVIAGQKTERAWRNGDGSTGACLRHENRRWCFEHFPAAGSRLEMLQISVEPLPPRDERPSGPYQYAVDYDLDGVVDLGNSKTRGATPAADTHYFFSAFPHRGDQRRADVQAIYDEGVRIALMYLGE